MVAFVRKWFAAPVLLVCCSALFAQVARVERAAGDLRVRSGQGALTPLVVGQTVNEGDGIVTQKGSAFLRFTDGQTIAVSEDSELRISAYRFDANQAQSSVSSLNLLRGAMRMLTGLIGQRDPASVRIAAGTATIGIRGTDVITALQAVQASNETTAFAQVISGSVELSTAGGSIVAGAGQTVSATGLAAPVASGSAMSAATLNQMSQLQSLNMAAGPTSGAAGVANATGAAVGGISPAILSAAALLGVGIAVGSGNGNTGTTTGSTTGTTGTR